ncbi:hypothetical protein CEUSTIGMA_g11506.t1 [Chlamydomonas eustigma]|uniref:TOG domain-containing protein n=1 Tax=Chlamydomonas eustigma TaxID=1157962 RepID=A0A250XMF7_9CHLO|nr:hypothetical protein CEUSTIGMA_g11506.t1 [Chlamydomonas eustigma]|eukprot:GAX84082.1 hypothetical protein CEUSTIGMA_g11506.t1 [Chlamydomonas eustigma]
MGSLFSKSKSANKVAPVDTRLINSAPATLSQLEGIMPALNTLQVRLSEPGTSTSTKDDNKLSESKQTEKSIKDSNNLETKPPLNVPALTSPTEPTTPMMAIPSPAAVARGPKKIDVIGDQSDGMKLAADLPAAIIIPEEGKSWAKVYGDSIIRYFHSADWKERENSLLSIKRSLGSSKFMSGKHPESVYASTCEMLAKTLKDKVAPIFHASLELVSTLLSSFSTQLSQHILQEGMNTLMPIMVHRCGNLNTRIHEAALQALLSVASFSSFGCGYVAPFAMAEVPKRGRDASQAAQMYGRLDLLSSLLNSNARSLHEISVDEVMQFTKQGLDMPDEKVRQTAIRVIVEVYKMQKTAGKMMQLEQKLGSLKPALMQLIQKRCEEADQGESAEVVGVKVSSLPDIDSRKLPALGNGIKVFGKPLPPLSNPEPSTSPSSPDAGTGALKSSGSMRKKGGESVRAITPSGGSSVAGRGRSRMNAAESSERGASPKTPTQHGSLRMKGLQQISENTPDLDVPKYTELLSSSTSKPKTSNKLQPLQPSAVNGSAGALDAAEEQLIQYLMEDQRIAAC